LGYRLAVQLLVDLEGLLLKVDRFRKVFLLEMRLGKFKVGLGHFNGLPTECLLVDLPNLEKQVGCLVVVLQPQMDVRHGDVDEAV
jgi:hypothetical protein